MNTIDKVATMIDNIIDKGWSYERLANYLCVSKSTISRWHHKKCVPSHKFPLEILSILESITSNGKKLSAFFQMNLIHILQFLLDSIMIFEWS